MSEHPNGFDSRIVEFERAICTMIGSNWKGWKDDAAFDAYVAAKRALQDALTPAPTENPE